MRQKENTSCYQNRTQKYPSRTGKYAGQDYRNVDFYNERVARSVSKSNQSNRGFRRERDLDDIY